MNIIMLGAPGAGKGTIASRLTVKYNIPHISTGNIFRDNIKNNTELGQLAKSYTEKGLLVPDEVTIKMLLDRLTNDDCKCGYILDGFPRNLNQAKVFDDEQTKQGKSIDVVILVDGDYKEIAKRLSSRRVCENCGEGYNIISFPSKISGVCDKCGGKLIQRKDDTEEIIIERINTYKKETAPLIDYYKNKNILKLVDGFKNIDVIMDEISKML